MRKVLVGAAALFLLTLAACSAQTTGATNVTSSSATYNTAVKWNNGDGPGHYWFEDDRSGSFAKIGASESTFGVLGCPSDPCSGQVQYDASGLPSDRQLRYRFCGYLDESPNAVCYDSAGTGNGTNYSTFRTQAPCTRTVAAGTSFSSAVSGLGSGAVLCLSAGPYNWGDYSPPSGITIKAQPGVDATVVGEARVSNSNVTLQNFKAIAAPSEDHAVIYITGSDVTTSRLEVDTNHVSRVQGYLVGGGGTRAKILDTVIHGARGELRQCADTATSEWGDNKFHAIYWFGQTAGEIRRVWMYDNGGFGLHFYSGTGANTQVGQTVTDDSLCGRGNVFDSQTGPVTFDRTIITDAGGWLCRSSGATVTNSRSQGGFTGCSGSGNVTADTVYQNEAGRDYRVPGNPDHQFIPGPQ